MGMCFCTWHRPDYVALGRALIWGLYPDIIQTFHSFVIKIMAHYKDQRDPGRLHVINVTL